MDQIFRPGWSSLPAACRLGHPWGPGQVEIRWTPCDCLAALAAPTYGHMTARCGNPDCSETQQIDVDALSEIVEDWNRRVAADSHRPCATPLLEAARRVLAGAHEHQLTLRSPDHLSPADVAGLDSWIHECAKVVYNVQRAEVRPSRSESLYIEELDAKIAALADAFHMYASMLERYRSAGEPLPGQNFGSLATIAEDERILLSCRATVRKVMQQLMVTVRVNR